jgi:hypothetical protein
VSISRITQTLVALGLWSVTLHAEAQNAHGAPAATVARAPGQQVNRAKIVLIGTLARDRELIALLHELLGVDGIEIEIAGADRFESAALFAEAGGDGDGAILAFIQVRDDRDARLHFRAPSGDRFLLRKVELPSGVDAVGRELLGQIVKSSLAVLLHSPKGLSRAEASAALARDAAPLEASLPPSKTLAPPAAKGALPRDALSALKKDASPPAPAPAKRWEFGVSAGYSVEWSGTDLRVAHGPGAAVELRLAGVPEWGVKLAAYRFFPQDVQTELVSANVQRTDAQMLFELGVPLAPAQFAFLALGPSLEVSHLEPTSGAEGVAISAPKTDLAPAFRGEARYELGLGPLTVGAMVFVNVSLVETHYDVLDDGVRVRAATLGAVRPGVALTLGLM